MRFYPLVEIKNHSTILPDTEIHAAIPAFQHQVSYDFRPYWDSWARIVFTDKNVAPIAGAWQIVIFDDSDQAGALGYHDYVPGNGAVPTAKVFAKTDAEYHLSWSVTLSHELLEMLADPYIMLGAQVTDTEWYGYEICDPVEDDSLGYFSGINTVLVSNFILPQWFIPGSVGLVDCRGELSKPLDLTPGGYASIYTSGKGWGQIQMQHGNLVPVTLEKDNPRFRVRGNG